MASLRHTLMLGEAQRRLHDAKRLGQNNLNGPFSDSAYLLSLLGFELLLKLVFELATAKRAPQHHKYKELFAELPLELQTEISVLAKTHVGPDAFAMSVDAILEDWSTNFIGLRYPYERYSKMSAEEYTRRGREWVDRGGPLADADFRYHPEALFGMVEALNQVTARHA